VLAGLELAHERWPLGTYCVWYPLTDRAGPVRFHRELERSGLHKLLSPEGFGGTSVEWLVPE
jgi:23S rRNA (adenine2030-N6)-methyltransferase